MSKKIITIALILVTTCMVLITGCYKVTTLTLANNEEVTRPVSFAKDIIPIFNKSCNMSGCHNVGGTEPDLSPGNAYNSLINGHVDLNEPEKSELYLWLTGKESEPMPIGAANNPSNINQLVLAWIKQGAKNN